MSNLKINEEQYLGKQELNRMMKFIISSGYKTMFKRLIKTYGIIFDDEFGSDSLLVEQGSAKNKISIRKGGIINSDVNIAINSIDVADIVTIPIDDTFYYIYVKHESINYEVGTVSIDTTGLVTGVDTKFTEVIRGIPGNAVKIRFIDSTLNLNDYYVLELDEVSPDTKMRLQGASFAVESDLKIAVVGAFSPGEPIDESNKLIYEYDKITFGYTDNLGGLVADKEFPLAKVKANGSSSTLIIDEDMRQDYPLTFVINNIIGGDVAYKSQENTFKENNIFQKDVTIQDNLDVDDNITAGGDIQTKSGSGKDIISDNDVIVGNDVIAGGDLAVAGEANVAGDVNAGGIINNGYNGASFVQIVDDDYKLVLGSIGNVGNVYWASIPSPIGDYVNLKEIESVGHDGGCEIIVYFIGLTGNSRGFKFINVTDKLKTTNEFDMIFEDNFAQTFFKDGAGADYWHIEDSSLVAVRNNVNWFTKMQELGKEAEILTVETVNPIIPLTTNGNYFTINGETDGIDCTNMDYNPDVRIIKDGTKITLRVVQYEGNSHKINLIHSSSTWTGSASERFYIAQDWEANDKMTLYYGDIVEFIRDGGRWRLLNLKRNVETSQEWNFLASDSSDIDIYWDRAGTPAPIGEIYGGNAGGFWYKIDGKTLHMQFSPKFEIIQPSSKRTFFVRVLGLPLVQARSLITCIGTKYYLEGSTPHNTCWITAENTTIGGSPALLFQFLGHKGKESYDAAAAYAIISPGDRDQAIQYLGYMAFEIQ